MGNVFEGKQVPYLDYLVENVIDYNTRIYRLVLDVNKDKVKKIAATGASFPISVPTGSFFDFNSETPYSDQNKDISIRFRCMGADYMDDILIREFNQTVSLFNPLMKDAFRSTNMTQVSRKLLPLFNNRGYARIDESTYSLEWYVENDLFKKVIEGTHSDLNSFYQSVTISKDGDRAKAIDEAETPTDAEITNLKTANADKQKAYNNSYEDGGEPQ
jgi:hypothetical protein